MGYHIQVMIIKCHEGGLQNIHSISARPARRAAKVGMQFLLLLLISVLLFTAPQAAYSHDTMVLAVHPYLPDAELLKNYQPLADYLSREIGHPMEVGIGKDYQDHVDSIGKGMVDIAFMGPVSYVLLVEQYGEKLLLCRLQTGGTPYYRGIIATRRDSTLSSLADLKGHRFAFGDPISTMSTLVPQYMLLESGVRLSDLNDIGFLGNHDNVALGVLAGDFDAGGVKEEIFYKYKDRGLVILAATPLIAEHVFVARADMPPELFAALQEAFFKLNDSEEGRKILQSFKNSIAEIAPASDSDYESLREILKKLNKINGK